MQPDQSTAKASALAAELNAFSGSLDRYRHWTHQLIFTPGVEHLAKAAGACWLIDAVASHQFSARLKGEPFQVWTLSCNSDRSADLVCRDGDGNELARQRIDWTDFPMDSVAVWLIEGTLLLPSEY